jgi:hypothetical protein
MNEAMGTKMGTRTTAQGLVVAVAHLLCLIIGLHGGGAPGARTLNPRIKRQQFTHSQYDYLPFHLTLRAPSSPQRPRRTSVVGHPTGQTVHSGRPLGRSA